MVHNCEVCYYRCRELFEEQRAKTKSGAASSTMLEYFVRALHKVKEADVLVIVATYNAYCETLNTV